MSSSEGHVVQLRRKGGKSIQFYRASLQKALLDRAGWSKGAMESGVLWTQAGRRLVWNEKGHRFASLISPIAPCETAHDPSPLHVHGWCRRRFSREMAHRCKRKRVAGQQQWECSVTLFFFYLNMWKDSGCSAWEISNRLWYGACGTE